MLASTWFDMVVGVDIHFVLVPTPAGPVPTPLPHPYLGMVFDPIGLAAGLAIGGAMALISGAPPLGPVLINGMFSTGAGTEGTNKLGLIHIPMPPGTGWAPFPKAPAPAIKPGDTPDPPSPIPPGDVTIVFGSKTCTTMGSSASRMGDMGMSCTEPIRFPNSAIIAIPKGPLVLIGGPPSLDIMSALFASVRTTFIAGHLHNLISRLAPGRLRNFLHRAACFLTGHPVDVATGRVLTDAVDAQLPGPLPFRFERVYSSACADRPSPMGFGWSHSLDQAVWRERGRVVYLAEDGREIEFDTFDFPGHAIRPGQSVYEPSNRLTLRCLRDDRWEVETAEAVVHELGPVAGAPVDRARLLRTHDRAGRALNLSYDRAGRLEWCRDAADRVVGFEHDAHGRLVRLKLPLPDQPGWFVAREYRYDDAGDLVEVVDAAGASWRLEYATHLLVRETDRTGISFYFEYDGTGPAASCVRTWGDGGIFDHVIDYDKANKVTFVTDSLGQSTQYHMNIAGLVEKVVDPRGAATAYRYDPQSLRKVAVVDPLGGETKWDHDDRGNVIKMVQPDGAEQQWRYNDLNQVVEAIDENKLPWKAEYDSRGRLLATETPGGSREHYHWEGTQLRSIRQSSGAVVRFEHDRHGNVIRTQLSDAAEVKISWDNLGRPTRFDEPGGGVELRDYDALGRLTQVRRADGVVKAVEYDAEGYFAAVVDQDRRVVFRYSGYHWLAAIEDDGQPVRMEYDTEGRLRALGNEIGETCTFARDICGRVTREVGFRGEVLGFAYDPAGRVVEQVQPDGATVKMAYDPAGRLKRVEHAPGSFVEYKRRPDGLVVEVTNEWGAVKIERGGEGEVVAEEAGGHWVRSRYAQGARMGLESTAGVGIDFERNATGDAVEIRAGTAGAGPLWAARVAPDGWGIPAERQLSGGVAEYIGRNAMGFPTTRRILRDGQEVALRSYQWEGDNRLRSVIDPLRGMRAFTHDRRGRLSSGTFEDGTEQIRAPDAAENVYRSVDRTDRTYGPGGQLLSTAEGVRLEYDARGRMTGKHLPDGTAARYAYDGAGNLAQVSLPTGQVVQYRYDGLGRRREMIADGGGGAVTRFIWDGDSLLHAIDPGGETTTWVTDDSAPTPVAMLVGDRAYSIISDQVGFPELVVDGQGEVVWDAEVDLYGLPRSNQGGAGAKAGPSSVDPRVRWPGQYADAETGLYYNRFRYYDPSLGLYITPDPLGIVANLRAYAYVPDPLVWMDLLGLLFGLYTFNEVRQGLAGTYIGSSVDTVRRLGEHTRAGRIPGRSAAVETAVSVFGATGLDGRRLLRLAEQEAMDASGAVLTNRIRAVALRKMAAYRALRAWYQNGQQGPRPKCP